MQKKKLETIVLGHKHESSIDGKGFRCKYISECTQDWSCKESHPGLWEMLTLAITALQTLGWELLSFTFFSSKS